LGKLPGIAKLDFDCKTATVTMQEGATLSRDAATKAIVDAGFSVAKFEGGPPPTVAAVVFRVTGVPPGKPDDARRAIAAAVSSPERVVVDATGAAAVTVRGDAAKAVSESALAEALKKSGFGVEGFAVKSWPAEAKVYEIGLPGMTDPAAAARARTALVGLEKVFWAEVDVDARRARISLPEPCSAIEANARKALGAAGFEVARFD
jgi:hypothetical protein